MLTNQPSIKQHLIRSKHSPNLAVWFVKHNWQTLHERRDYLPPKRIVTRNAAQDSPETVNVVWTRVPALACFSEAGCRLSTLRRHTQTQAAFSDEKHAASADLYRSNLRWYPQQSVRFTMAIVSLERSVTVLEAGRGAAAASLLTPPPRGDIGGRGEPSWT